MIKAHEIQGVIALENSFTRGARPRGAGEVASTAVSPIHGRDHAENHRCVSNAWIDGQSLRAYGMRPTPARASRGAGDATSRAVRIAWMTLKGEMGYPPLSPRKPGLLRVLFRGKPFLQRSYGSYVMEKVLFKISYPAEFLPRPPLNARSSSIGGWPSPGRFRKIVITTHESRSHHRQEGTAHNPADRDHCIQYMTAIAS